MVMDEEERRARLAALYIKSWLEHIQDQWIAFTGEEGLNPQEQSYVLGYFNSLEKKIITGYTDGTTRMARKKL